MRLEDIMTVDSIEDILSDDPLEDALEDLLENGDFEVGFLGKLVKGIAKGVKAVGKVALPIVKMVPGVGNVVSAAETGVNLAVGVGKMAGIGKSKGGAAPAAPKKISTSATPAVVQASVRASKAKPAPKKAVIVAKPSSSTKSAPQAVAIQPSVIVKAQPLDISRIVGNFSASVSPQLNAIAGLLKQQQLQAQAQSEHNKRVKDAAFKRHVVKQLASK